MSDLAEMSDTDLVISVEVLHRNVYVAELFKRLGAGDAAAAEVERLRKALQEAIELVEDVADTSYAQNSTVYKHKIAELKAVLEEAK